MGTVTDLSRGYVFTDPVDVPAVCDQLGVEYLAVDEGRAFVLFVGAVIDCTSLNDDLSETTRIDVELIEEPAATRESPATVLEAFVDRLVAATGASVEPVPE